MISFFGKTPFFRLLLPVITGILLCYFSSHLISSLLIPAILGLCIMTISQFIKKKKRYSLRWVFGSGLYIFLISLAHFQFQEREDSTTLTNSEQYNKNYYIGTIANIPEIKPRSIACNVNLSAPNSKKVLLYFEKSDLVQSLQPGDEIVFYSKLESFRKLGNPDDFDYPKFMRVKGFSGSCFVASNDWLKTGNKSNSITYLSQKVRAKALELYKSFELTEDEYALISALTLGYKNNLSENLQEAFRASGTAHVLAVSGLHVGIIYLVIGFIFSFLGNSGKLYILRQSLIITALWGYAFIAGLSPSIVRAAIMLTINCIANMYNKKGFTLNTLCAAAFIILIFNPFSLFDISFQMSFGAVLSILYFQPKLLNLYNPSNKILNNLWKLSAVSISAQLGLLPLTLYYFGTFPTYFFFTNILVVPLVALIIYLVAPLIVLSSPIFTNSLFFETTRTIFQWIVKTIIDITLQIVYFTEALPLSQLNGLNISLLQAVILICFIYIFTYWILSKRPKPLIISLTLILMFLLTNTFDYMKLDKPELVVFNSREKSDISLFHKNRRHFIDVPEDGLLPHPEKSIFRLSNNTISNYSSEEKISLDILILSENSNFNIENILSIFKPSIIVLDSSMPSYLSKNIATKCKLRGIEVHDVKKDGAFSVKI